jgi:hypothetical protein
MARLTLQQDGISIQNGVYVDRPLLLDEIIRTADENQHVVLSSPPATGKSSILELLTARLESENERVFQFVPEGNSEIMKAMFKEDCGLPTANLLALRKVPRMWILIDDAQRGYAKKFDNMWEFLVKDLGAKNRDIKVVIASTHDMTTLGSPAAIGLLPHVFANFTRTEVTALIGSFCGNFEIPTDPDWEDYWNAVQEMSLIQVESDAEEYHVGVILRCLLELERVRKIPHNSPMNGKRAQLHLRGSHFLQGFDRCFAVDAAMIQDTAMRYSLTGVLLGLHRGVLPDCLKPLIRAGVCTAHGTFSCQAANWFYNQLHFPNRASTLPQSPQDLIVGAVKLLSAERLKACVQDEQFPLETSFQHLLNETMTCLLPTGASIKPEYRTKAPGFLGDTKHGFIDFYVNDTVQWAIELLRLGSGLTEHRNRFHPITGKYRTLPTKKHLVVDIRGPKGIDSAVPPKENLCVLYFSGDWTTCMIQMESETDIVVRMQL